ncbi:MAG TPA: DUF1858 domain-containing protein [Candidatus Glassbacteria bacterium]|nr:DUF1858 domain-containing protein [Candidatus Glassbacteria bacterium]
MKGKLEINPETRVADLLEAYPKLEPVLIEQAPMFQKIQNPVLRKTVAKVATLGKAAAMAGIDTAELVRTLRRAAGLPVEPAAAQAGVTKSAEHAAVADSSAPDWVRAGRVVETIEADEMLASGTHPLNKVRELLAGLAPGELIRINSSFPPIPLVEAMKNQGHEAWTRSAGGGKFETFVIGTRA